MARQVHRIYTIAEVQEVQNCYNMERYLPLRRSDRETDRYFEEMLTAQNQLVFQSIRYAKSADSRTKRQKEEVVFQEAAFFQRIETQCKYALEEYKERNREIEWRKKLERAEKKRMIKLGLRKPSPSTYKESSSEPEDANFEDSDEIDERPAAVNGRSTAVEVEKDKNGVPIKKRKLVKPKKERDPSYTEESDGEGPSNRYG
ncbi:hypothetical protein CRE_16192 [Caenorhabditis remanei]|uniref:Uncharacterized protein n=2 Tax=Caenorhabditis remanei TaxID=31234 RepID=E3MSH9_CAERE|nr:hypothetical protein CRE_16192 [Caenorhabditis remanei]